jgi:retinol dehydrogenase 14
MAISNEAVILVTGATDGIGKQTALELASTGARIILHGRNDDKANAAKQDIHKTVPAASVTTVAADFSSLQQVRKMAERIKSEVQHIDVLINNAGVYMKDRMISQDGFEMTFAVNHLAPFLLTNLLLDLIKKSPQGRIVTVSSMVHTGAVLNFQNLNAEKEYSAYGAYALSKLSNVFFSKELSEQLNGTNSTSNCLHPGVVGTKMLRAAFGMTGISVQEGAATSVYLAVSPEIKNVSGKYFVNKRVSAYSPQADDAMLRERFWNLSRKMTGL